MLNEEEMMSYTPKRPPVPKRRLRALYCQAQHDEGGGCGTCGGYGIIIHERKCATCGHIAWVRPGTYTSYEGKTWRTFDGVIITDHLKRPSECSCCVKAKK